MFLWGALKAAGTPHGADRWITALRAASIIAVAYFLTARLGLALLYAPSDVAVFWPASGVAAGIGIVLGRRAFPALVLGVLVSTVVASLMGDRSFWTSVCNGFWNAGEALLAVWLLERWFGPSFTFGDLRHVAGFLVAAGLATAASAIWGAATLTLLHTETTAPYWQVWQEWFLSSWVGLVVVAPLVIGLAQAWRKILAGAIELLGADMGAIRIFDATQGVLKIGAYRGFDQEFLDFFREVSAADDSACGRVLRSGKRMVIEDVEADTLYAPFHPIARAAGYRAVQSTPIISREGALLGTLATHFRSVHKPAEHDLHLLDLYVRQAAEIIERHDAEDALRESEERLRLAQLRTGVGIWDWNLRTGRITCTPELEAIFGLEPGTVKSYADFRDRVHPEDIEAMEARREAALRCRETFRNEFRIIRPDGKARWILALGGAVYDEATGEPTRILGNNTDITERNEAELALSERNLQLALAGKAGLVGSYVYDARMETFQISEGYAAIHGLRALPRSRAANGWLACIQRTLREYRHSRARPSEREPEYYVEYRILRSGGEVRWIESRSFISYGSEGQPQRVVGVNIDISERKRAELALAERDAQLALAAKAARVGCYANNLKTGIITVSEGYTAIHGLPDGTAQTTLSQWRTRVHPGDLAPFDALRQQIFGNRQHDYTFDYRIIRADGGVRWIESRGCVSYDEDGQPQQCVGINIDVTERKQTEARISDGLAAGQMVAFEWDAITGRSLRSDNADRILGCVEDGCFLRHVHPDDRTNVKTHICDLCPANPSYALTFRFIRPDDRQVWLEETAKGEFDDSGRLLRVKGLTRDITERKELEDHKNTLIAELDHRVKNVLATVSTVATRTQETNSSMADFVAALDGRIKSMASTHELLSHRRWQGIPLAELVHRELAPYATANNTRIDGPEDVVLSADAAQTLAMALHELATNAAKFGSLSAKSGRVSVHWNFRRNGHADSWLCIHWEERGGPNVVPPTRSGFGTSVVRELIPYELGGTVELMHPPEGVRCNLQIPTHWLSASNCLQPPRMPSSGG
jgi:PAS domain S-box-containing protein